MRDPDFEAWIERAKSCSVVEASAIVKFEPKRGYAKTNERPGPCPRCGGTDRFAINVSRNVWNCRGCGKGGRDGLGLVMWCLDLEFLDACEEIAGPRPAAPDGESEEQRAERRKRAEARVDEIQRERQAADAAREREVNRYREDERRRAYDFWRRGYRFDGSPAEIYLKARGLDLPSGLRLRWHPQWTLYEGEEDDGRGGRRKRAVHRGPAMFSPLVTDGTAQGVERFEGLHITWFDDARPGKKIMVRDADGELVPAKKIRGVHLGCHIVLVAGAKPVTRLFIGEGIETVLSVWTALHAVHSPLLDGAAFWTSGNLGNLAGKAVDRLFHPTETKIDKRGRTYRVKVPGIVPDLESRAVVIPDSVTELYLIGDGDSEPFRTRCVLARAAARHARQGRTIFTPVAKPGKDFNDMVAEAAA